MYGIPETERLSGLVGRELIQVCIGSNQIIFKFFEHAEVSVESSIIHIMADEDSHRYDDFWKENSSLPTLLGSSVKDIERCGDKNLNICFSNGETISLSDESDEYECFQFRIDDEVIVV